MFKIEAEFVGPCDKLDPSIQSAVGGLLLRFNTLAMPAVAAATFGAFAQNAVTTGNTGVPRLVVKDAAGKPVDGRVSRG